MTTDERLAALEAEVRQLRIESDEHHGALCRMLKALHKLSLALGKEIDSGGTLMKAVFALARHSHPEPMKGRTPQ